LKPLKRFANEAKQENCSSDKVKFGCERRVKLLRSESDMQEKIDELIEKLFSLTFNVKSFKKDLLFCERKIRFCDVNLKICGCSEVTLEHFKRREMLSRSSAKYK
jgi:hypothetical protein